MYNVIRSKYCPVESFFLKLLDEGVVNKDFRDQIVQSYISTLKKDLDDVDTGKTSPKLTITSSCAILSFSLEPIIWREFGLVLNKHRLNLRLGISTNFILLTTNSQRISNFELEVLSYSHSYITLQGYWCWYWLVEFNWNCICDLPTRFRTNLFYFSNFIRDFTYLLFGTFGTLLVFKIKYFNF